MNIHFLEKKFLDAWGGQDSDSSFVPMTPVKSLGCHLHVGGNNAKFTAFR